MPYGCNDNIKGVGNLSRSLEWAQISSTSENQHWSGENYFGLVTVVVQCLHFNDENKSKKSLWLASIFRLDFNVGIWQVLSPISK
jgi:hypothetical protein